MPPNCNFPSDPLAQQFCNYIVDPAQGLKLSSADLDSGVEETRFIPVNNTYHPSPQKIGFRDGVLSAPEVYQKITELSEKNNSILAFAKGKLEIPWIPNDLDPTTPEDECLRNWVSCQVNLIKADLAKEGKQEGSFPYSVELGKRLFGRLILPQNQGGFGLSFDPDKKNSPRTLIEIYRQRKANCVDFTILSLMVADLAKIPAVPVNLLKDHSGAVTDHLRIGFRNPASNQIEKIADLQLQYFGDPKQGEVMSPVSRLELLGYYYNAKAVKESDPQVAESHVDFSLKLSPRNYLALFNKGFYRYQKKDFPAAKQYFLASIQSNPIYPDAYWNLHLVAKNLGEIPLAQWAFHQHKNLSP